MNLKLDSPTPILAPAAGLDFLKIHYDPLPVVKETPKCAR
jgi:hypothetical protein